MKKNYTQTSYKIDSQFPDISRVFTNWCFRLVNNAKAKRPYCSCSLAVVFNKEKSRKVNQVSGVSTLYLVNAACTR